MAPATTVDSAGMSVPTPLDAALRACRVTARDELSRAENFAACGALAICVLYAYAYALDGVSQISCRGTLRRRKERGQNLAYPPTTTAAPLTAPSLT